MREATKHRRAFDLYVRLGSSRSLESLRDLLVEDPSLLGLRRGPVLRTLEAWSTELHWQDKLRDLEREAAAGARKELVRELSEMNERHAREGLALQQKSVERLQALAPSDMNVSDAIKGIIEGVRLERLARGAPTDHQSREEVILHGAFDLTAFSNEELRRLVELAERSAARASPPQSG